MDRELLEILAWKLAEIGGSRCYRDVPDPNRFIGLDTMTQFLYHERAEDILDCFIAHGYEVNRASVDT